MFPQDITPVSCLLCSPRLWPFQGVVVISVTEASVTPAPFGPNSYESSLYSFLFMTFFVLSCNNVLLLNLEYVQEIVCVVSILITSPVYQTVWWIEVCFGFWCKFAS